MRTSISASVQLGPRTLCGAEHCDWEGPDKDRVPEALPLARPRPAANDVEIGDLQSEVPPLRSPSASAGS